MHIDFAALAAAQRYHLMTQVIVPRPIAWVLSDNGMPNSPPSYNLAPFSYFNAISSEPALIVLSIGEKPSGEIKDTRRNILDRKDCVIHIPSVDDAREVSESAVTLAHGESEIEKLHLSLVNQIGWRLPRLAQCKIAMACTLYDYKEIGPAKQGVIFCEIKKIHIDDSVVTCDQKQRIRVDAQAISPLSRLGSNEYATFGQVFQINRPK